MDWEEQFEYLVEFIDQNGDYDEKEKAEWFAFHRDLMEASERLNHDIAYGLNDYKVDLQLFYNLIFQINKSLFPKLTSRLYYKHVASAQQYILKKIQYLNDKKSKSKPKTKTKSKKKPKTKPKTKPVITGAPSSNGKQVASPKKRKVASRKKPVVKAKTTTKPRPKPKKRILMSEKAKEAIRRRAEQRLKAKNERLIEMNGQSEEPPKIIINPDKDEDEKE